MKKVFIMTGELSGDLLGAWYVRKQYAAGTQDTYMEAIGGDHLQGAGAVLYQRFETLNVTGIVEIIKHIPRLLSFLNKLAAYLVAQQFDEVVVIDFPGFNVRLIKKLKKLSPSLKITYFSPPQLWCWGAWRLASLKKYCDRIIVLYPFEVEWYHKRGVQVEWIGSPVYDRMQPHFESAETKKNMIALVPGSRVSEVTVLFPLFAQIALALKKVHPSVQFVIPQASSIPEDQFRSHLDRSGLLGLGDALKIVRDDDKKWSILAQCCMALSKPGTVTLELALLKIPACVIFKVPWLTYWIARMLVSVPFMSLPNLLLHDEVYKEFIQYFTSEQLKQHALHLYQSCVNQDQRYVSTVHRLEGLRERLNR